MLSCNMVATEVSANPESSEIGMVLHRVVLTWGKRAGPFYSCSSQVLDTGHPSGRDIILGEAVMIDI